MITKPKFVRKYMRMAYELGETENPCHSRKIGTMIINDDHEVVGMGYNGPPAGTPHCDTEVYLREFFWPQLTKDEKESIALELGIPRNGPDADLAAAFSKRYNMCGTCPRRLIGAKSGQRTELCSCQHAERNAINKASRSTKNATMFAWCGIPCIPCTGAIINARIGALHCLTDIAYHDLASWLFERAGVKVFVHDPEKF